MRTGDMQIANKGQACIAHNLLQVLGRVDPLTVTHHM